jgi:hypothetical protein
MKDILFLPLDIPYLTIDYDKLVSVAQTLDTIADEYRNCEHIPIRWTKSVNNVYNKLEWTDIAYNEFPEIIEYAELHLKPFVGEIPRIMIITTPPYTEGFDHIDCSPKVFDDVQLKFRSVLHGKTSTLYFLNEHEGGGVHREYAPEIGQQPFLMDGGWPHGLDNFTEKYKFTLAIGAPWSCEPIPELVELVEESKLRYEWKDKSRMHLMADYEKYFSTKPLNAISRKND